MWFDLVFDVLAATILIPIIIGAVVTHGERRKLITKPSSEAKESRSAPAAGRPMLSHHAGSVQRGAWHVVLAARDADRKTAADGIRAVIDESAGAVGWGATGLACWSQQLDLAPVG
jgi:hypothetical protein